MWVKQYKCTMFRLALPCTSTNNEGLTQTEGENHRECFLFVSSIDGGHNTLPRGTKLEAEYLVYMV